MSLPIESCNITLTDMNRSSTQWRVANSLLLATAIRIGLVVISYGAKVPAGIFVPSMAIGATFGRMLGIMVKAMYQYVISFHVPNCVRLTRIPVPIHSRGYSHFVNPTFRASLQGRMPSSVQRLRSGVCRVVGMSTSFIDCALPLDSGVMRITVTVVVIMFELTGALTYILPTMVRL